MKKYLSNFLYRIYYSAEPPICMDVATWAKERGLPVIETHPAVLREVEPCIWGDKMAQEDFHTHYDVLCQPQVLVPIEKATLRCNIGLVHLPDGKICYQGNWNLDNLKTHPAYKALFPRKQLYIHGNIYSLLSWWGQEFYHWFHDVLPRLEYALPNLPSDTKFLIQGQPRAYQLDSLSAYGIGGDKLIIQSVGLNTQVERLWFATPIGHTGLGSGSALKVVAQRITKFFGIDDRDINKKRIYISRRKANARRVVNEKLLESILDDYGFKVYTCEDLSLREQVKLFSEAEAIIGPHGAGLVNMIYAPEKTLIGEISTLPTVPCYFIMAKQLRHCFSRLQGKLDNIKSADMNLEPENLKSWLESSFTRQI